MPEPVGSAQQIMFVFKDDHHGDRLKKRLRNAWIKPFSSLTDTATTSHRICWCVI